MKSKISICFLTIVVILLALVMIEKIKYSKSCRQGCCNCTKKMKNDKEEKK